MSCLPPTVPTGNPLECRAQLLNCGPSCTPTANSGTGAVQCNLGTACSLSTDGSDPCNPAGLVCDSFEQACRRPLIFEPCVPGGPACRAILDSTESDLRCVNENASGAPNYHCLEPCQETSDCIRKSTSCAALHAGSSARAGFGNYDCSDYFGPCDSDGTADGTCTPVITSTGDIAGECIQARDGGATCSPNGNRQNGGLCGVGEACLGGLCQPGCNAGTGGTPGCAGTQSCEPIRRTGDPVDNGICELTCDFTSASGGGCPTSPIAEKCLSTFIASGFDSSQGFCAAEASSPTAVGQPCVQGSGGLDPCVAGASCAITGSGSLELCRQLCNVQNPSCPPGLHCNTWRFNSVVSQFVGLCD